MSNKDSIFNFYSLFVIVGFGGTAFLSATGKGEDTSTLFAFLGFYTLLGITGMVYMFNKQKDTIEALTSELNDANIHHSRNLDRLETSIVDAQEKIYRYIDDESKNLGEHMNSIESSCRNTFVTKKK